MSEAKLVTVITLFLSLNVHAANKFEMISKVVKEETNICGKGSEFYKKTGEECAVKKVRFESQNYSMKDTTDKYPYYGTLGYFGFEANSWADLTKYGFVQRLRGCTYESKKGANGKVTKRIGESIKHLGEKRVYVFPDWSNDAGSLDPLYYGPTEEDSNLPGGRLALYRWTPKLGVVESKKTKDLYEVLRFTEDEKAVLSPSVFVTDTPSMAYAKDDGSFQNVAMEFNICLYKMEDIPLTITSDEKIAGTPIVCHAWSSQFEFDHTKKIYKHLPNKGLDNFCATQEPLNPQEAFVRGL